jgi:hypothetical protein
METPSMNPEPEDQAQAGSGPAVLRPGRALIGWMPVEQAKLVLAHNHLDGQESSTNAERIMHARSNVVERTSRLDQSNIATPPPAGLNQHIGALTAAAPDMFIAGWQVQMVDLQRLRAIQPVVFTDDAGPRVGNADPSDVEGLARITVPLPSTTPLPMQFDQIQRAWTISSPNPNLRIVGQFSGPTPQGPTAVGFLVRQLPSYVQVAQFQGRYLLHDGYHRTLGLLSRGITHAPAFVREFNTYEEMGINPGMLPQESFLGQRPATLKDYLDDRVAAAVQLPYTRRMIVIGGLELTPPA